MSSKIYFFLKFQAKVTKDITGPFAAAAVKHFFCDPKGERRKLRSNVLEVIATIVRLWIGPWSDELVRQNSIDGVRLKEAYIYWGGFLP